jgi:hypothetical protein
MNREHTATVPLIIGGIERMVCVVFEIESYGSAGSWDEPPEGPSIVINDVRNDDECGRSIYELCSDCRDLWGPARYVQGYFHINHGPATGTVPSHSYCHITFNGPWDNHTLLDTLYEVVCDKHFPDYEPQDDDVF